MPQQFKKEEITYITTGPCPDTILDSPQSLKSSNPGTLEIEQLTRKAWTFLSL